ncbi:MAG: arginine repressor [Gemmatimonadetes bacterium]|nr:arginine repressor [Gemmatimonadota bacterium]NIO30559.1 arginine repressor [Gemmatimonadota bacterium]
MAYSSKMKRHEAILELIRTRRVHSQDELRLLLRERGLEVTQATLSRDLRELRVAKLPRAEGESYYATPESEAGSPALERLLPHLLVSAEGVDNLIVVKTLAGGAQAVAEALDMEEWPELLGTVAGDDTILIVLRQADARETLIERIEDIAQRSS